MASAAKPAPALEERPSGFTFSAKRKVFACLLLAVLTLALYNPVSHNGFVNYDDDRYILTNPHVRAGLSLSTIVWAFTSTDEANWHPLTWISHALDCQLFQLNPAGHHYTSLLLHLASVVLLFLLLVQVTLGKVAGSTARGLFVAALFAVHPLNVESVAWVAERKSVLAMLFFLLTLAAYGWYVRKPSLERYLLVPAMFALALMSKPMVITLPFALLLLDYWPLGRMFRSGSSSAEPTSEARTTDVGLSPQSFWQLCREKLPLFAMSAASAMITMAAQKTAGAVSSDLARPLGLRLENAAVSYVLYLAKAFWPSRLAVLYPYPHSLPAWEGIASAAFLTVITALVIKYREHRYLPVGWFWFLGTMVPMIGIVQVGNQAMADRYAYLPMLGIFVMVVWGVADLAGSDRRAKLVAGLSACAVITLAAVTHAQIAYWHDDLSLWSHTLTVAPQNFVAENNVGAILAQRGRAEEAVVHFRAASALEPDDAVSQMNLGVYAQQHGDIQQATARYESALAHAGDARIRASAYAYLGQIYFAQHDYARARADYEAAARLNNAFPLQLGLLAQKTGDWNAAAVCYAQVLSAQPSDVGFLLLEQALRGAGREQDAARAHQKAELLSSDMSKAQQIADDLLRQ